MHATNPATMPPCTVRHWWTRPGIAALALALVLPACTTPTGAVVTWCSRSGDANRQTCTIRINELEGKTKSAATMRIAGRQRHVALKGRFTAQKGRVKVFLAGAGEPVPVLLLEPGVPATVETVLRLHMTKNSFHFIFEPDADATSLEGRFSYSAQHSGRPLF